jgi:hypothetical protein
MVWIVARMIGAAIETRHAVDAAMQFDHVGAARALVQAVDVLRDEALDPAGCAEPRERAMRRVRLRAADHRPADHAARPVAPARGVGAEKVLQLDRRRAHPFAVAVAIAGNAGIGADARAGQHEQPRMALDEGMQRIERGRVDAGGWRVVQVVQVGIVQAGVVHVGGRDRA